MEFSETIKFIRRKSLLSQKDFAKALGVSYIQVRDNPDAVITCFEEMPNTEIDYYRIREEITNDTTPENAARFIFLSP